MKNVQSLVHHVGSVHTMIEYKAFWTRCFWTGYKFRLVIVKESEQTVPSGQVEEVRLKWAWNRCPFQLQLPLLNAPRHIQEGLISQPVLPQVQLQLPELHQQPHLVFTALNTHNQVNVPAERTSFSLIRSAVVLFGVTAQRSWQPLRVRYEDRLGLPFDTLCLHPCCRIQLEELRPKCDKWSNFTEWTQTPNYYIKFGQCFMRQHFFRNLTPQYHSFHPDPGRCDSSDKGIIRDHYQVTT